MGTALPLREMCSTSVIMAPLAVYGAHLLLGVALACGRPFGYRLLDAPQILLGERHVYGPRVLLEVLAALGAGDGDDVISLMEQPREGELPRRRVFLGGDLAHPLGQLEVLPEVLLREAREAARAGVILRQVLHAVPGAGQEAASQGAVGYEADA